MEEMNICNEEEMEIFSKISIDRKELARAKKIGKSLIYKRSIQDQVEALKDTFDSDEYIESYFCGQNAIIPTVKALTVLLYPKSGLQYAQWKTDMTFVITNKGIHMINQNCLLEKIDVKSFTNEEIKKITYFKTDKRKILTLTPKEGEEYAIFIEENMEESIDDIVERFKYNVEQKDYLPKSKKLYNFIFRTSIIIAIAIILTIIIKFC